MTTPQSPSYRLIPLTQGQFAKVSPHRYEDLMRFKWCARWSERTQSYYALTNGWADNKVRIICMHRYILGLLHGDKRQGDHWNHDTLDNTDGNLRIATCAQNMCNRGMNRNNTTGYKGVIRHGTRFKARIMKDRKLYNLGTRDTAEAAHRELYVPAALRLHGEFARIA